LNLKRIIDLSIVIGTAINLAKLRIVLFAIY